MYHYMGLQYLAVFLSARLVYNFNLKNGIL